MADEILERPAGVVADLAGKRKQEKMYRAALPCRNGISSQCSVLDTLTQVLDKVGRPAEK